MSAAVEVALAIALRGGRVLVTRRAPGLHLGGLWEFPGGKIEAEEDPSHAARRELLEETGLAGGEIEPLLVHAFEYSDRGVRLHAYVVSEPEGDAREGSWVTLDELARLEMPAANAPILRALRWRVAC